MWDLEQHFNASKPRISRRASLDNARGLSSSQTVPLPAYVINGGKQGRRSSLGFDSNNNNNNNTPAQTKTGAKKQARRASLGQMLGNAQKFFTKDDAATVDSDSSCNISALDLLEHDLRPAAQNASLVALQLEMEELIQHHTQRRVEMEVTMENDLELAKARLASGNQLGAILSMRRVHKNTTMLAYASAAKYQLTQIANQVTALDATTDRATILAHRAAMREITEKLLKADTPTPTDAFLLNQLESQMQEVGV